MTSFADSPALSSPDGLIQSLNPFLDLFLRSGYHAPEGGFPEEGYTIDQWGNAVPLVTPERGLGELGLATPPARLLSGLLPVGPDLYNQQPGAVEAGGGYLGVPKGYTDAEIAKLVEWLTGSAGARRR